MCFLGTPDWKDEVLYLLNVTEFNLIGFFSLNSHILEPLRQNPDTKSTWTLALKKKHFFFVEPHKNEVKSFTSNLVPCFSFVLFFKYVTILIKKGMLQDANVKF